MKYKAGDRVKIREWEDMAQEYTDFGRYIEAPNGVIIVPQMKKFCGKETTISKETDKRKYLLEADGGKCLWPECALLPVTEKEEEI